MYSQTEFLIEDYLISLDPSAVMIDEGLLGNVEGKIHKLLKSYQKNMVSTKKVLAKHNIDSKVIERHARKTARKTRDGKANANTWMKSFKKMMTEDDHLGVEMKKFFKVSGAVAASILAVIAIAHLNTYFFETYVGFFDRLRMVTGTMNGPPMGLILAAGILGPLLEEAARLLSVVGKFPWLFTAVFASTEYMNYMRNAFTGRTRSPASSQGIARMGAVFKHTYLTMIQTYFHKRGIRTGKKYWTAVGFAVSFLVHGVGNIAALVISGGNIFG